VVVPEAAPVTEPVVESLEDAGLAVEDTGEVEVAGLDEGKFLINLNRCTVEDLLKIKGVGPKMAKRIVEFRNGRGQFTNVDELRLIPGVGRKTFRALTGGVEPRSLNRILGVEESRQLTLQEIV